MKWVGRFALVALGLLLLGLVGIGIELYQSQNRRSLKQDIEQFSGSSVRYAHQYPYNEDQLSESLRERLGDHIWTEVLDFSHVDWSKRRDDLNSAEVDFLCNACGHFPRLRSFTMMSCHFSCEQMKDWPCLATLEEVSIWSSKLDDDDLAIIGKMSRLKSLSLIGAKISAKGLAGLEKLSRLEVLSLTDVEFSGDSKSGATALPRLKRLEIENCSKMHDDAIVAMGKLPALEDFVSNRTALGDRTIAHIVNNGSLHLLIMNESLVTDSGLKLLAGFQRPLSLHVANANVTNEGLKSLAGIPIESLVLADTAVSDDGLVAIGMLKSPWYLSLERTKVTGTGLTCCDPNGRIANLTLEGTPLVPAGVALLAKLNVDQLSLAKTPIGDTELLLFTNNDQISSIDVRSTKVTADGIKRFYEQRQKRLAASGRQEKLLVVSQYPGMVEEFLPESEHERIADWFGAAKTID